MLRSDSLPRWKSKVNKIICDSTFLYLKVMICRMNLHIASTMIGIGVFRCDDCIYDHRFCRENQSHPIEKKRSRDNNNRIQFSSHCTSNYLSCQQTRHVCILNAPYIIARTNSRIIPRGHGTFVNFHIIDISC